MCLARRLVISLSLLVAHLPSNGAVRSDDELDNLGLDHQNATLHVELDDEASKTDSDGTDHSGPGPKKACPVGLFTGHWKSSDDGSIKSINGEVVKFHDNTEGHFATAYPCTITLTYDGADYQSKKASENTIEWEDGEVWTTWWGSECSSNPARKKEIIIQARRDDYIGFDYDRASDIMVPGPYEGSASVKAEESVTEEMCVTFFCVSMQGRGVGSYKTLSYSHVAMGCPGRRQCELNVKATCFYSCPNEGIKCKNSGLASTKARITDVDYKYTDETNSKTILTFKADGQRHEERLNVRN